MKVKSNKNHAKFKPILYHLDLNKPHLLKETITNKLSSCRANN